MTHQVHRLTVPLWLVATVALAGDNHTALAQTAGSPAAARAAHPRRPPAAARVAHPRRPPAQVRPQKRQPKRNSPTPPPQPPAKAAPPAPTRGAAPRAARPGSGESAEVSDEELLRQIEKEADDSSSKVPKTQPSSTGGRVLRFIQSLNPDISAIGCFAGAYYYDHQLEGKGNIVPQGGHDPGKTGLHLQEIELALQSAVDPYFRMDVFLSISPHGLHIEEGYFTTLGLPAGLQLRLGQMFARFGRFNQAHLHTWSFADSMVPVTRLLGGEGLGGLAGEVSWMMPLPWYAVLSLALMSPTAGGSFLGEGDRAESFHIRHPGHLAYVLHLAQFFELSANTGLSFGLSYGLGPNNSGGYDLNMTHLLGADIYLKIRNLRRPYSDIQLTVEGYGRLTQVPQDLLFDWGLYALASFRLSKRWWLALRYDMVQIGDSSALLAFGFAEESPNPELPLPVDDQHRGSVAVTFAFTHFSQIRLQYNNNWTRRLDDHAQPGAFRLSHEVILQLQGNIGTHGAHPY